MKDEDRAHYLEGEIIAITVLFRALIETHPNPQQLQELFEEKYQVALAATVPAAVKDAYLEGLINQAERLWHGYGKE